MVCPPFFLCVCVCVQVCEASLSELDEAERICNEIQVLEALQDVSSVIRFRGAYRSSALGGNSSNSCVCACVCVCVCVCACVYVQGGATGTHSPFLFFSFLLIPSHPISHWLADLWFWAGTG